MPTATPLSPIPPALFGDLHVDGPDAWSVDVHTESLPMGKLTLRLQTSSGQTDDGKRGTWHVALLSGGTIIEQTQVEWMELHLARDAARKWARTALLGDETAREPVDE